MTLNSVNTNSSALIALQNLNRTNQQLEATQNRVSTGFRVGNAKDDGAAFSIAQGLRGDMKGYDSIREQLSKAKGLSSVAGASAKSISDTLGDIRAVVVKLADENVTGAQRDQYIADYEALKADIQRSIDNASFNGTNLLNSTDGVNVISNLAGDPIELTGYDLNTDIIDELDTITDADSAKDLLDASGGLVNAETNIGNVMADIGADSRTIDSHYDFIGLVADATEDGIGAIVDADLAKESAKLQALQIRQQLGTQTLSIANQAPNALLSLFKS